ncbi:PREDICTED: isocitrate dehydrogenase [NAD] subunit gamma, mitochondrial-like [Nicrophorus vespilloides]|uniref:Isocitrate dehydrogenase [NAD] subunit gamma, mitochondrial-like n=1 Tax=Nicrophorus vespilloides TaxID=110193 RepID=A0ABM1MYE1_NICVS|nr:PREDICTED: isocitrate dehydrogenase [NAD] subunit gamma, mitochondrial-like [Nicrophorus vespilloides]
MNFKVFYVLQKRCVSTLADEISRHAISKSSRLKKYKELPVSKYGGRHIVTMIPGCGNGPEMMNHIRDIFKFINAPIDFEVVDVESTPTSVKQAIMSIRRNGCCIKGSIERFTSEDEKLYASPNVAIRKKLDLFCSLNICKSYLGVPARYQNIDIVIVRENVEGEYSMLEHQSIPGVVESMKVCTTYNSERIARWTFEFAKKFNRKKISIIHKANIMKLSDGLFLRTIKKVAKEYPNIQVDQMIVDNCCMQIVSDPHQFDILVCPNLYGTILCNVVCGLIGGPSLISAANFGYNCAAFETATRSPESVVAEPDTVSPVALINASIELLFYLGYIEHAKLLRKATSKTVEKDLVRTKDIGGTNSTTEMVEAIKTNISAFNDA